MAGSWQKSSFCDVECVELCHNSVGGVDIRDSKRPSGLVVNFTTHAIGEFLEQVRAGVLTDFIGQVQVTLVSQGESSYQLYHVGSPDERLEFNQAEMIAFAKGVCNGEFDHYAAPTQLLSV